MAVAVQEVREILPEKLSIPAVLDLRVEAISKSFGDEGKVLDCISFEVERGQSVALIGSSRSGKSTLLQCCVRLLEPDSGTVHIFGENTSPLSKRQLQRVQSKIGFLGSKAPLNSKHTVLRAVLEGALPRKNKAVLWIQSSLLKTEREEAMRCLECVGAAHLSAKLVSDLSPADARRVAIAKILMLRPQLIIADEPVADLDIRSAEKTMDLLLGLVRAAKLTLLFSSHDLVDALSYADRALALHQGKLELDAPVGADDARVLRALL